MLDQNLREKMVGFQADGLVYHSTLGSRVIPKKKRRKYRDLRMLDQNLRGVRGEG